MKYDSLIFDLDGTLWDSVDSVCLAWNDVIQKSPLKLAPLVRADFTKTFGKNHQEIMQCYFTHLPEDEREKIILQCYKREESFLRSHPGKLYEEVSSGLKKLSEKYALAIVSNCQRSYLNIFLEQNHLQKSFLDTLCYEETGLRKSQNIRRVIERNKFKNSAYMGDTLSDQVASEEAQIPFYFAKYGFGNVNHSSKEFCSFAEAVKYFDSLF